MGIAQKILLFDDFDASLIPNGSAHAYLGSFEYDPARTGAFEEGLWRLDDLNLMFAFIDFGHF